MDPCPMEAATMTIWISLIGQPPKLPWCPSITCCKCESTQVPQRRHPKKKRKRNDAPPTIHACPTNHPTTTTTTRRRRLPPLPNCRPNKPHPHGRTIPHCFGPIPRHPKPKIPPPPAHPRPIPVEPSTMVNGDDGGNRRHNNNNKKRRTILNWSSR